MVENITSGRSVVVTVVVVGVVVVVVGVDGVSGNLEVVVPASEKPVPL